MCGTISTKRARLRELFSKNIKLNNAKTINHKLSSLRSYNDFLISSGVQSDMVIQKTDMVKFQTEYASPTQVTELEVKQFMQKVLESKNKRNYAVVILLAYTGMRISEALAIWLVDFNLQTGECISGTEKVRSKEPFL
jgi:integrase/recombinase XerD